MTICWLLLHGPAGRMPCRVVGDCSDSFFNGSVAASSQLVSSDTHCISTGLVSLRPQFTPPG